MGRGARAVDRGGLENRCACKRTVGSNPTLSATPQFHPTLFCITHGFKYRLAFVADGVSVLRYDNEAGKGDHKHVGEREVPYRFTDLATLQADFWKDVETWRAGQ